MSKSISVIMLISLDKGSLIREQICPRKKQGFVDKYYTDDFFHFFISSIIRLRTIVKKGAMPEDKEGGVMT